MVARVNDIVRPAEFVIVPGPLMVEPVTVSTVFRSDESVAVLLLVSDSAPIGSDESRLATVPDKDRVPAPEMLPAFWFSVPPETLSVRPVGTLIVPMLVKLGVVPDCVMLKLP